MKKYFLEGVVFICGAVVMAFEIVGSRILGPYLGTSIFIWTSLIGTVLASLSLGYWLGGRLADHAPSYSRLAWIILLSAVFIFLGNLFKDMILRHLPSLVPGLKGQSVVASLLLFAPAAVMLGMVSPYAVRLKISNLQHSGRTVGNLYALSTVGSIAGTFLAGFFLLPLTGTTGLVYAMSILQAVLALSIFLIARNLRNSILPAVLILLATYALIAGYSHASSYLDLDTRYNRVWIYDGPDPESGRMVKFMRINNESSSAMFPGSDSLVFAYTRNYRLAEHLVPGFHSALMLGGAAYSFPKYFLEAYPAAALDVVEIDPELTRLAKEHFRLKENPRMRIFHEDARTYINSCGVKYDVIYGDLFRSQYTLPWHLTTLEAAREYDRLLSDNGCILVNIITPLTGPASRFLSAELATFRQVFPEVRVLAAQGQKEMESVQSVMLVACKKAAEPEDGLLAAFGLEDYTASVPQGIDALTDDKAPVDFYMAEAIR